MFEILEWVIEEGWLVFLKREEKQTNIKSW
jgi:hypothetical protein